MEILYEFNYVGIAFTAIVGGLCLLLLIPTFVFASKRIQPGAATVLFRVLDILLIVAIVVVWCAYALSHATIFGFSITDKSGALSFSGSGGEIFALPEVGGLVAVFDTVLGTVLLGLLTAVALLSIVLSFACRRRAYGATITIVDSRSETPYVGVVTSEPSENVDIDVSEESDAVVEESGGAEESVSELSETDARDDEIAVPRPAFESEPDDERIAAVELQADSEEEFVPVEVIDEPEFPAAQDTYDLPKQEPDADIDRLAALYGYAEPQTLAPEQPEERPEQFEERPALDGADELTSEIKDAIRVAAMEMPQSVKDALRVVVESSNALVVKEVLRVLVSSSLSEDEPIAVSADAVPTARPAPEPAVDNNTAVVADDLAPRTDEAEESDEEPKGAFHVGLFKISNQASRKMYKSSLRRPENKKN